MKSIKRYPDFIGIGCQNCGTTWISACIAQHPDIFFAPQKEVSFFDMRFDKGWDWYIEQFTDADGHQVCGEWSPGYICNENALTQSTKYLKNTRVLTVFRNPVDRLYSHYLRYRAQGATHLTFESAIDQDPSFVRKSLYANDWAAWVENIGAHRCLALTFEEMTQCPQEAIRHVFEFLGVDEEFEPNIGQAEDKKNELQLNRYQWMMDLVARGRDAATGLGLSSVVRLAKKLGFRDAIKSMASSGYGGYGGLALTHDQRVRVYHQFFESDVEKLQNLLPNLDLRSWNPEATQ